MGFLIRDSEGKILGTKGQTMIAALCGYLGVAVPTQGATGWLASAKSMAKVGARERLRQRKKKKKNT